MSLTGTWNLRISTPIGTQLMTLELSENTGTISGTARGSAESTPLLNPLLDGNRLTWQQTITKPMRLHLTFDVLIDGDTLTGTSKAGMLPASIVTGTRAT